MDLVLEVRTADHEVEIKCAGRLVAGPETELFRRSSLLILSAFESLTLDLAELRSMDAAGVGVIASLISTALCRGRSVRLANVSPKVSELLSLTGLSDFIAPAALVAFRQFCEEEAFAS